STSTWVSITRSIRSHRSACSAPPEAIRTTPLVATSTPASAPTGKPVGQSHGKRPPSFGKAAFPFWLKGKTDRAPAWRTTRYGSAPAPLEPRAQPGQQFILRQSAARRNLGQVVTERQPVALADRRRADVEGGEVHRYAPDDRQPLVLPEDKAGAA